MDQFAIVLGTTKAQKAWSWKWTAEFTNSKIDSANGVVCKLRRACAWIFLEDSYKSLSTRAKNYILELRIWSWFRLNAGGVDETCKSNGKRSNPLSVAKGLGMYEQSTFYLGITTGNGR